MSTRSVRYKFVFGLIFLAVIVLIGIRNGAIPVRGDPYALYEPQQSSLRGMGLGFSYADRSSLLGKPFMKHPNQPNTFTWVSVTDFDGDGFEDVLLIYRSGAPGGDYWFQVLHNNGGMNFSDVTEEIGLGNLRRDSSIRSAGFVDIDNDRQPDLLIARKGVPALFFRNIKGHFVEDRNVMPDGPLGEGWGIALFDYDRDGYLDSLIYNYNNPDRFPTGSIRMDQYPFSGTGNKDGGGEHFLLHNDNGKRFVVAPKTFGPDNRTSTQAVGVGDFDGDGYPDFYASNDYGFDQIFMNHKGEFFEDRTDALGFFRSSNSMSATVADWLNEGRLGVFASNVNKPGLTRGFNRLWQNHSDASGLRFTDEGQRVSVAKCGWGWGSQALDFDKDGWLDFVMVNGRHGDAESGYWHLTSESLRAFVPAKKRGWLKFNYFGLGNEKSIAPGERNCLFLSQKGRSFWDVARDAGLSDELNGRSLAWLDLNNDGQEDLIIGNAEASELLYLGRRTNANQWLGLRLEGTKSNRMAYGARVVLLTGTTKQTREVFPTNGFLSQSSPRVVFGIPSNDKVTKLEIRWPSGIVQSFNRLEMNRYHDIREAP